MPKRAANLKDRSQRALTSVSNAVQNTGWTMDSSWKLLNSHYGNRTNPPLLIKYDFSLASYTVSLTDLTYLWTETLDRRQVIKRALNLETSIDPSEDGSQMQLLLRRIREAFEGREGTSITINGEGDSDKLILTACITLPSPLLPLEWPITCIRASQSAFTTQFVLPSLALCSLASAQVTSLLQHLKDKEYVINKLVDKIQSDGTDLSKIFPGVPLSKAGSKVNARGVAAKSVRGLAEFDEIQWRSRLASGNDTSSDINDLVSSVFGSDSPITSQDYGRFLLNCEGWKRSEPEDKSWSKSGNQSSTTSFESKPLQAKPQPEADVLDGFQVSTLTTPGGLPQLTRVRGKSRHLVSAWEVSKPAAMAGRQSQAYRQPMRKREIAPQMRVMRINHQIPIARNLQQTDLIFRCAQIRAYSPLPPV